jgi:hypothetical protein
VRDRRVREREWCVGKKARKGKSRRACDAFHV